MEACGVVHIKVPSKKDEFTFYNLSDIHLGNKACAKNQLQRDIDKIKRDKYARWFATGDLGEYISTRDRRMDYSCLDKTIFDTDNLTKTGKTLKDALAKLLMPIADKCLGLGIGNHEWSYEQEHDQSDLHISLCNELGVRHLGYTAFLDTVFDFFGKKQVIRHFLSHGKGAAQSDGGKINTLVGYLNSFDANIYWVGHLHDQLAKKKVVVCANERCTHLKDKIKLGVMSGSYFRTYAMGTTTYAERKGYAPTFLGCSVVKIRPFVADGSDKTIAEYFAEV